MKRYFNIFFLLIFSLAIFAEDVSFQANAPKQVIVNKPFQLTYSVNQHAKDLRAPELAGFDVLAGPFTSQSTSTSFVNGQRSSSFTLTFTYTLRAIQEGDYSIAPATINVGGTTYKSNGLKISVLPADEPQQQADNSAATQQGGNNAATSQKVNTDNLFVKTNISKTRVHEQECILLSYKVYWAGVDLVQLTNNVKLPEFKGFMKQDLEQSEIQTQMEHYNGRNYQTAVIYQTLLYPQKAGDIKIDPASFEVVLRVQNRAQVRSIFDDFFATYTNVTKTLNVPATTIHVDALPSGKPAGFSGGVGSFTLESNITEQDISTNDAVTLTLSIKGNGNMKLLKNPAIDWPEGFEVYDPKVTNNFKTTTSGMSGTKTIEYLAIARAAGDYTIPAVEYSYYDTKTESYQTLTTPEYTIHVARGANDAEQPVVIGNNFSNKEDIRQLGEDIRFIKTAPLQNKAVSKIGLYEGLWWLWYVLPLLLAVALFGIFRKRIQENADLTRVRYKKANKVAQKRLKAAKRLMQDNNKVFFYEEIERAALSYLSDRLSIPTANLNKENIAEILRTKNTSEELIKEVLDVLSAAEFARYAPSVAESMEQLYDNTATLIDHLEETKL